MPEVRIDASDLTAVRKGLADSRRDLAKEQRKAHKEVAVKVAEWARSDARSGTRAQAHFADALQGRSTQQWARVAIASRGRNAGANTAFMGMRPLTRTGWNASRYSRKTKARLGGRRGLPGAKPQGLPWVGNTWIGGRRGEGPYVINATIAKNMDRIEVMYDEAHVRAVERAFPHGGST